MINYTFSLDSITPESLEGFFVGWPNPPSKEVHFELLLNSGYVWLAVDEDTSRVVGFITAISDEILSAYISFLEVLPQYQKKGIGKQLMSLMTESLKEFYMVDLVCDKELLGFYNKLGMKSHSSAILRNHHSQALEG